MISANNGYNQQNYATTNQVDQFGNTMYNPSVGVQPLLQGQQTQIMMIAQPIFFYQPKMTGFQKLQSMPGIFIKQKFNKYNALCGWEQQNRYFVYGLADNGKYKKGSKMLKCYEKSPCFQRQLCAPHCRTFNMAVRHKDYQDVGFNNSNFLQFEREFKCSFFCLARPVLKVHSTEAGSEGYLGKITNPFICCELICEIYDNQDSLRYKINASCCQCGIICEGPCFQSASLDIQDNQGNICGSFKRVPSGIAKNCCATQANFAITFPPQSTPGDKALFIAAAIMIDFSYFEKKQRKRY